MEADETVKQWKETKKKFDKIYLELKEKKEFSREDLDDFEEEFIERYHDFIEAYKTANESYDENNEIPEDLADDVNLAIERLNRVAEKIEQ